MTVAINVLRYTSPALAREYIREFVRLIRPNRLIYFERCEWAGLRKLFPQSLLRVHRTFGHAHNTGLRVRAGINLPKRMRSLVSESGGQVLGVDSAPDPHALETCGFFITKRSEKSNPQPA